MGDTQVFLLSSAANQLQIRSKMDADLAERMGNL